MLEFSKLFLELHDVLDYLDSASLILITWFLDPDPLDSLIDEVPLLLAYRFLRGIEDVRFRKKTLHTDFLILILFVKHLQCLYKRIFITIRLQNILYMINQVFLRVEGFPVNPSIPAYPFVVEIHVLIKRPF